ncbi:hypothetical protein FRC20_003583 [Serendipita sp. 405]|nr:hypothetical protein FRC20_003583 [Serendipita sp. 405]
MGEMSLLSGIRQVVHGLLLVVVVVWWWGSEANIQNIGTGGNMIPVEDGGERGALHMGGSFPSVSTPVLFSSLAPFLSILSFRSLLFHPAVSWRVAIHNAGGESGA